MNTMVLITCYVLLILIGIEVNTKELYTLHHQHDLHEQSEYYRCSLKQQTYPIIQAVADSHFELGRIIGSEVGMRIRSWVEHYSPLNDLLLPYVNSCIGKKKFEKLIANNCHAFPSYCDELAGLANQSQVTFKTFMIMSLRHELSTLAKAKKTCSECTDILTSTRFAHNEDGNVALRSTGFFVNATVTGTNTSYFAFHYPASLGGHAFGFNRQSRLAFSMNALFPQEVVDTGLGIYFLLRSSLDAVSLEDAIDRLNKTNCAYGGSINIGSPKKNSINIELGPHGAFDITKTPSDGSCIFHMNEYLHLPDVVETPDISSQHRIRRAKIINEEFPVKNNNFGSFLNILGDKKDIKYPLFRDDTPPDDSATASSVVFNLGDNPPTMLVYVDGNPLSENTSCLLVPI